MRNFQIFTDSCSDLGADLRSRWNINYFRMHIMFRGKEMPASLDWDVYSVSKLYDMIRSGDRVTTTQVPAEDFKKVFEEVLSSGEDLLYIACSSGLSGSVNTASIIAQETMKKYPGSKIVCVDSLNSCLGEGAMAVTAAQMRKDGKSIDEVGEWLEENKLCFNQFCTTETLEYLRRAGRVKASSAFFGNLFGVKPIIISDAHGNNFAIKKVKGRANALNEIVAGLKATVIRPEEQCIYIAHSESQQDCDRVKEMIENELHPKDIYVNSIGPIIGSSTGPGTVVVYGIGQKVETVGE